MAVTNNYSLPEKKYSIRYGFVSNIPFYLDDQFKAGWATYDDPNIEMSRKALTPSTTVNYTTKEKVKIIVPVWKRKLGSVVS